MYSVTLPPGDDRNVDNTKLSVRSRQSVREFDELESEWSELLQHCQSACAFLSWDWVRAWWTVYGKSQQLFVIEVRAETGLLVALAPLKIKTRIFGKRVAEFLGQGAGVTPEYLDFLVRDGWADRALPVILEYIAGDENLAGFDLRTIPSDSPTLHVMRQMLPSRGTMRESEESQCPIIELPGTWEEYLATKSKNYRKKIREYEKRCERDLQVTFRRTQIDDLLADMNALRRLHRARWESKSRAFLDADYIEFHANLANRLMARDALRLYLIESGGQPIAALYCFRHGDTIYYYQSGRDPRYARYRLGLIIIHWAVRESILEGAQQFDLLTGTEAYKQRWATSTSKNLRVRYERRSVIEKWVIATRAVWCRLYARPQK
jgi:CelD/BcsL family acetyltransferase involved in cellulose biosynthesis